MNIAKDVERLAKLEREVRTIDRLIQTISSMSEEELVAAWPRIELMRAALERHEQARRHPGAKYHLPLRLLPA